MSDVPLIVDPAATFADTITVSTAQVIAFQEGMAKRIQRQIDNQNRLLKRVQELEEIERANADEIARLSHAIAQEQLLYTEQKALLDRARAERDELLSTFGGMMLWLKDRGVEHTSEGLVWTTTDLPRTDVDATWDRHIDPDQRDAEDEVREAIPAPQVMPLGEQRPGRHLAGD